MGEMEMVRGRPVAPLATSLDAYVGYCERGSMPGTHRGLPSGRLTFIVTIDDPCDVVVQPGGTESPGKFNALVGGLHVTPAMIAHNGFQHGIQLDLSPLAARRVLGVPAAALPEGAVELDSVLGRSGRELWERIADATTWPQRFAVLDDVLARWAGDRAGGRGGSVVPELERAWTLLELSGGAVSVNELAAEVGWSRRHLAAKFRAEFGVTPKVAGRMLRFDRTRHVLPARRGESAAVAAECGYADQAHMIRDFHQFCGCSPSQWLAEEFSESRPTLSPLVIDDGQVDPLARTA